MAIRKPNPTPTTIHHLSINQNHTCFAAGLDTGFRIYECDRYKQIMQRDNFETSAGGIRHVAMLFRCNLMCLILDKSNEVVIWDDHRMQCLGKLCYRSQVRNVKLQQDRIVVVLTQRIYVYNLMSLRILHEISTEVNVKGMCEVSHRKGSLMLVCPGLRKGQVRVEDYVAKKTKFIVAHNSGITCLALTLDGRFMATASIKGTLIRVFNTENGSLLQEVRRGADRADIYSLAFCSSGQWLAASSDKGTVHVFGLKLDSGKDNQEKCVIEPNGDRNPNALSTVSSLSFFKGVLPRYFSTERSVARFRVKEGVQYLVGFGKQNTIVIIGMDGSYYKCAFDSATGGEMTQLEYHNFFKPV